MLALIINRMQLLITQRPASSQVHLKGRIPATGKLRDGDNLGRFRGKLRTNMMYHARSSHVNAFRAKWIANKVIKS